MARLLGVVVALGVLSGSCLLLAACDKDDDFIPMGPEAGRGGEVGDDGGAPVVGRGGSPGHGGTQSGEGGDLGLGGGVGVAGEGGAESGGDGVGGQAGQAGTGQAGQAAGGGGADGGAGGSDPAGGVCDGESVPVPEDLPTCTPAVNDPDGGNECRECMKQRCCEAWQACYGEAPRGACGYGPRGDEIGQMDCVLYCYHQDVDGVKPVEDVLDGCLQKCVGSCASASQATTELLSCAVSGPDGDASGNDDCLDICFPAIE